MTRALALAGVVLLASCTKQGFLKAPEADDEVSGKVGSFSTETHFLLEPIADAEDLLGRAVHVTSKGAWTIADERAPGCEVRVKRSKAEYEKNYRIGLGDMTSMSGGYSELLSLEARYGRSVEAAIHIQNQETLTADTEGPCGEVIVQSVRVGTGERRLVRKAEGSVKGRAGKGPVGVEGGREAATDVADEMKWTSPQAYAFTYEAPEARKVFEIDAEIPEKLVDGEQLQIKFASDHDAYLIVYYIEESGVSTVLYPRDTLPVPMIKAGEMLALPPQGHDPLQAQLRDPAKATRETLVVYAFADRGDWDRFKPSSLVGSGEEDIGYVAKLTQALAKVPISRWDRHTFTFEISPKKAASAP